MQDQVGGADHCIIFGGKDYRPGIGVSVKGRRVQRSIIPYFRAQFDLWRKPVLPAKPEIDVPGLRASALTFHIVVKFRAERRRRIAA